MQRKFMPMKRLQQIQKWQHYVSRTLSSKQSCYNSADVASLYVHWPYCEKRCTYCNFNKYISKNVDHERMRQCLVKETATLLDISAVNQIKSVFFGGGTPSLALPSTLGSIIKQVEKSCHLVENAEITMEANPTSTETSNLKLFKQAGINRISIGIQSLSDKDLRLLGREHSASDALRCLEEAKHLFPGRTSVDLIFGLPDQTTDSLQQQLQEILPLCDDHVSLYQLTLERGTALFKQVMDREVAVPDAEGMADLYTAAVQELQNAGFHRYEASNFSRHKAAESCHNKAYWEGAQYIGVGPGAHGRFAPAGGKREARIQTLEPDNWMWEVEKNGHATRKTKLLEPFHVLQEILYLGLRTQAGIPEERWQAFSGGPSLHDVFGEAYIVRTIQKEGYLKPIKRCLQVTEKGLNVVDSVARELLDVLDKFWTSHFRDNVNLNS